MNTQHRFTRSYSFLWSGALVIVFAIILASTGESAERNATPHRYSRVEGGVLYEVSKSEMMLHAWTLSDQSTTQSDGNYAGELHKFGFGNCSTPKFLCLDFVEFALSIPLIFREKESWELVGWKFRVVACLMREAGRCSKYSVTFRDDKKGLEGGLLFNSDSGVDMFYYSTRRGEDPRQIFVRTSEVGVFANQRF